MKRPFHANLSNDDIYRPPNETDSGLLVADPAAELQGHNPLNIRVLLGSSSLSAVICVM
jgi:hypothetical protein